MKILIYGAGVIGSLYAVLFAETGYDTSIYARGKRLEFLKKNGLLYKKNQNIRRPDMKFYESGDSSKPVIFLFPGTCCLYSSFDHILDRLHSYFYTVTVSYDGFDPNEKTEFYSMEDECEKIEQEIKKKYDGRIKAAYGCSLGGSFVSLLIQRKRIHIDHGIIGSSDMDEAGSFMAKLQSSIIVPIMYKMVHTGKLPKFMQKKINEADESRKKLIDGFVNMFGIDKGGSPWITKQSIYNQFYSDLVTKVQHGIDVPGTTIHVFYATKMGKKYEKRYWTYFKNPDIRRHNMQHEELFCCHSAEWVEEVKNQWKATNNERKSECDRCAGNDGTDLVCKSKRNKKEKC